MPFMMMRSLRSKKAAHRIHSLGRGYTLEFHNSLTPSSSLQLLLLYLKLFVIEQQSRIEW